MSDKTNSSQYGSKSNQSQNASGQMGTVIARTNGQQIGQLQSKINQDLLPTARTLKGFVDTMQVHDPQSGDELIVAVWESDSAMRSAQSSSAFQSKLRQLQSQNQGQSSTKTQSTQSQS